MKSLTGAKISIGASVTVGMGLGYQKKGLATALAKKLIKNLKAIGVKAIYTLVSWNDWDLLRRYFKKLKKSPGCLR
jgi:hypothetical protein